MKSIRDVSIIKSSMFTACDRLLLEFQKQKIIESESSDDAHRMLFTELLEDQKPGVRLSTLLRLRKNLKMMLNKDLNEEHTKVLIKGLYENNPMAFEKFCLFKD